MKDSKSMITDLGIGVQFIKGETIAVRNCWHFSTDGNAVGTMFYDAADFKDAMNRIAVVTALYNVVILAFVLMDTHVHFVLYGEFDECNRFMHDFIKRTSMSISFRHGERKTMLNLPISHQKIDDLHYLKTVICYVLRNPSAAGLPYLPWDYPWSSGSLYFRTPGVWSSALWTDSRNLSRSPGTYREKRVLKCGDSCCNTIEQIIFPAEYVDVSIVERLFRTPKSFLYYLGSSKEIDVESRGGIISGLSIPMQEMRMNRDAVSMELFGKTGIRSLDCGQRIRLAKALRNRYNSSVKQLARLCGLMYEEVKDIV